MATRQRRVPNAGRSALRGLDMRQISCIFVLAVASVLSAGDHVVHASDLTTQIEQITNGPLCHFFGYIGHVRTIPWNASGRYIVGLQTSFQERMPLAGEAADIVLIDTHDQFAIRVIDQTRAWNFQQGTMLCWNPQHRDAVLLQRS